jgi:NAD(P)-dependent dehydrogenase (short-subunit alcohol dehydrogenase family)
LGPIKSEQLKVRVVLEWFNTFVTSSFRNECGPVSILINNAGIMPAAPFLDFGEGESIRRIFNVNVLSQFWMLYEFLPEMLHNGCGGHVVSVCSVAGITGVPYLVPYCSSKHAIRYRKKPVTKTNHKKSNHIFCLPPDSEAVAEGLGRHI